MRLRKPCIHDKYDEHYLFPVVLPGEDIPCPGGEFLPEGALIDELVRQGVLRVEETTGCHRCDADAPAPHEPDTYVSSRRFATDWDYNPALASQVGESE